MKFPTFYYIWISFTAVTLYIRRHHRTPWWGCGGRRCAMKNCMKSFLFCLWNGKMRFEWENSIIGNMLQRIETFSHKENYFLFLFFSLYFVTDFICFEWDFPFLIRFLFSIQIQWQQFHNYYTDEERRGRFFVKRCYFRLKFHTIIIVFVYCWVKSYTLWIHSTNIVVYMCRKFNEINESR